MKILKKYENFDFNDEDFDFDEEEETSLLLTDDEYLKLLRTFGDIMDNGDGHLRKGQAFMIALSRIRYDLYEKITGTEYDCFYDDNKVMKFLRYINQLK